MSRVVSLVFVCFACLLLLGLGSAWAVPACTKYDTAVKVGQIENQKVDESSGVVASRKNPGVWWTHNDSGGKPRIFAFDDTGKHLGTYTLEGASAFDWEDIAAAPCPDGTPCLYAGDVGDNGKIRKNIVIYRFPEPTVDRQNPADDKITKFDTFTLTYPDGAHNCETLIVHPKSRDIIVVTKDFGRGDVYSLPGSTPPSNATLKKVGSVTIPLGLVTAGDISPDGDQIVLRNYQTAFFYKPAADGIPSDANKFMEIKMPTTVQAEGIAYSTDGQSVLTTTERTSSDSTAPLHKLPCANPPPEPANNEPTNAEPPKAEPTNNEPTTNTEPSTEPASNNEPTSNNESNTNNEPTNTPDAASEPGPESTGSDAGGTDTSVAESQAKPPGCGCQQQQPASHMLWLLLLGLLALRRPRLS